MPKGVYERSPDAIQALRAAQLRTHLGRSASAETKAKMSQARRGQPKSEAWREQMAGEGNGRYLHGHDIKGARSSSYRTWSAMLTRCLNPQASNYARYGGRGITVCDRWRQFEGFLADMGARPPGLTIDRFPNNDGNYEPGNCRWATASEQRRNQRPRR